jgi:hypothetical protein
MLFLIIILLTAQANKLCKNCKNFKPLINKCFHDRYTLDKQSNINHCNTHLEQLMINEVREILLKKIENKYFEWLSIQETCDQLEQEFFSEYDYYTIHDKNNKK